MRQLLNLQNILSMYISKGISFKVFQGAAMSLVFILHLLLYIGEESLKTKSLTYFFGKQFKRFFLTFLPVIIYLKVFWVQIQHLNYLPYCFCVCLLLQVKSRVVYQIKLCLYSKVKSGNMHEGVLLKCHAIWIMPLLLRDKR